MNKRDRWTILDVEEDLIESVKRFAKLHGYTTAGALKELVELALLKQKD